MASENKIAAAILTAAIAQRATQDAPIEEAPATIARLYTEFRNCQLERDYLKTGTSAKFFCPMHCKEACT